MGDMSAKMNGLKATMDRNAEDFKSEISRIDKRLNDHESKTNNMINKAIAEALAANNARRDAEMNALIDNKLASTSKGSDVEALTNRIKLIEESRTTNSRNLDHANQIPEIESEDEEDQEEPKNDEVFKERVSIP